MRNDSENDLALIQIKAQPGVELEPLKMRGKSPRLGEEVIAIGYPLRGILGDGFNVTTGTISALRGVGNDSRELQFTAAIQLGNSGGALVDRTGAFLGVVTSKLSDKAALNGGGFVPHGVNFAIRKEIAIAFLDTLGLSVEPMDYALYVRRRHNAASTKKRIPGHLSKIRFPEQLRVLDSSGRSRGE